MKIGKSESFTKIINRIIRSQGIDATKQPERWLKARNDIIETFAIALWVDSAESNRQLAVDWIFEQIDCGALDTKPRKKI